jgi:hypothetical protein
VSEEEKPWSVVGFDELHVMPTNDLREHRMHWKCWCNPMADDGVYVHHALDQREAYETGRRLPQ